jgi:electron transfer flavoprotein beta subunit
MTAKKKPITQLSIGDAGIGAAEAGLASALTKVTSVTPRPPKTAGTKTTDDGDGGAQIAAYLVAQKLI